MKKNLFTLCMMLLLSMLSFAQGSLTISGVVTEKKTGEPIIGASILLKGQSSGTITDFNGNYSIPNVPSGATLVFSYIALSRERLLDLVWGYDYEGDIRTVDVHIQKLRKKLGLEDCIKTVYKLGYRLEIK